MKRSFVLLVLIAAIAFSAEAQKSAITNAAHYSDLNQLDQAKKHIDKAVAHESTKTEPRAWYNKGLVYTKLAADGSGKFDALAVGAAAEAFDAFKKVIELEKDLPKKRSTPKVFGPDGLPRLRDMCNFIASGAFGEKDFERAFEHFKLAVDITDFLIPHDDKIQPNTDLYYNLSLAANRVGNKEVAKDMFQKLIAMDYKEEYVYRGLTKIYLDEGNVDEALKTLEAGRAAFPESQGLLIEELNIYLSQDRAAEALDKFKIAIEQDPDNPEIYFALGTAYDALIVQINETGDEAQQKLLPEYLEGAREAYKNTIRLDPENFGANLNLGASYYNETNEIQKKINELDLRDDDSELQAKKKELFELAMPYLEKASDIKSDNIQTLQALKEIYVKTNQMEKYGEIKRRIDALENK